MPSMPFLVHDQSLRPRLAQLKSGWFSMGGDDDPKAIDDANEDKDGEDLPDELCKGYL